MKKLLIGLFAISIFLLAEATTYAQEITKYDFLEVIVIQKANNGGKIKRIKVEDQQSLVEKIITIKEMESIKSTSGLLNYMNTHNWEFVDRKAITEIKNPIWMSYIFKKQK
ncbi:MAG: hypothetical protein COB12_03020 [Flavobacterium sp.]|nr:MAG: hypothetical protein COB12_03020 [Flavobacterium sp.]